MSRLKMRTSKGHLLALFALAACGSSGTIRVNGTSAAGSGALSTAASTGGLGASTTTSAGTTGASTGVASVTSTSGASTTTSAGSSVSSTSSGTSGSSSSSSGTTGGSTSGTTSGALGCDQATLTWTAPTENTYGSCLTDLQEFLVQWGNTPGGPYDNSINVGLPCTAGAAVACGTGGSIPQLSCTYTLSGLTDGPTYFVTVAVPLLGGQGAPSAEVEKTISCGCDGGCTCSTPSDCPPYFMCDSDAGLCDYYCRGGGCGCDTDSQCVSNFLSGGLGEGLTCINGFCASGCNSADDCGLGSCCDLSAGAPGTCIVTPSADCACAIDDQCNGAEPQTGYVCGPSGTCVAGCKSGYDCPEGEACDKSQGFIASCEGICAGSDCSCIDQSQCSDGGALGLACLSGSGLCGAGCASGADCSASETCDTTTNACSATCPTTEAPSQCACTTDAQCNGGATGSLVCNQGVCATATACSTDGEDCEQTSDCCGPQMACMELTCCGLTGSPCTATTDCCADICVASVCCVAPGETCGTSSDCCSGSVCQSALCCVSSGGACSVDGVCCRGTCQSSGLCK